MCGNTCDGNGNIQRLRSILKEQELILSAMNLTLERGIPSEQTQAMIDMMEDRMANTKMLIERAQTRQEEQSVQNEKTNVLMIATG